MKSSVPATNRVNTLDRLNQIRMSPSERRMAKAYLHQAELLVDMLMWVDAELRRVLWFVGQGIGVLARRSKLHAAMAEPS